MQNVISKNYFNNTMHIKISSNKKKARLDPHLCKNLEYFNLYKWKQFYNQLS